MRKIFLVLFMTWVAMAYPSEKNIRIQHFGENDGFSEALVQHMMQDTFGYIWLATWDGLYRYDGYRFSNFKAQPGDHCPLETNRIAYIEEDADHNIICYSNDRFYLFNRKTRQFSVHHPEQGKKIHPYKPSAEARRCIGGIRQFDNVSYSILLEDSQKGIWIYSYRGLERISIVPAIIRPETLGSDSEEVISAVYTDKRGRLWSADKNGYVRVKGNDGTVAFLGADGSIQTDSVRFGRSAYCFYEDSKGCVWIGCKPDGLFRLTPYAGGFNLSHFMPETGDPYSINCENIYDIAEDNRHRIVVATYGGGLNIGEQMADGRMRFINCNNLLKTFPKSGVKSRCLWITAEGTALIGTNDGLYTVSLNQDYGRMHFYVNQRRPDTPSSISSNYVMEILRTGKGELFVATSGGGTEKVLSDNLLSDNIEFRHYSVKEGISSDMNQTLTEAPDGTLWIISMGSISLLNTATGIATNYWRMLTEAGEVFTEATPARLADGRMVLGTTRGILTLSQQQMAKSSFIPPIVFDCEQEVWLSADEQNFNIRFAALDYNKNEDIIYTYRLEGVDSQWRYTRNNELNYVKLSPGTYKLHIKSTNGDGVWVDNEVVITLHRAAYFNETPLAWMLYGLLLAILFFAVWFIVRYIRTLKRELKHEQLTSKQQLEVLGDRIKELLSISESVQEVHEEDDQLNSEDRQFTQRLKAYVEDNIDNADLAVIDIANAMNVSRTVLFIRMKHIFGCSPNNYVLNTRINYAKRLLMQGGGVRVSEVAFKSGFSDPKYFSRCFKKLTGCLPREFYENSKSS